MKNPHLTVVMYHYVRDLHNSRYPSIKGLDSKLFEGQVDFLQKNYSIVTMEQVLISIETGEALPEKSVLLTFDDGYADHFTTVFPILYNRGLQGSFFAPVKAVTQHTVLDVNKIHFILASTPNTEVLLKKIEVLLDKYRLEYNLQNYTHYYNKLAGYDRYDTPQVLFIKRLLQVELPLEPRMKIVDELFVETVAMSQDAFSRELYMTIEQMKTMVKCGMHIGSHGYDHFWLSALNKDEQKSEIEKSVDFIKTIGGDINRWTICYPYGDYNENALSLLSEYGCSAGFCTEVRIANLIKDHKYTLPRLDTNDIPKSATADKNQWWEIG